MGREHQNLDIAGLVEKLRYVTAAVQILPFIYSLLYIVCMILYLFCSDTIAGICDSIFYVSPISIIAFLVLSKLLRMCVWHRTACILPVVPQILSLVDRYVVEFPWSAGVITLIVSMASFLALLLCAYKVFIK